MANMGKRSKKNYDGDIPEVVHQSEEYSQSELYTILDAGQETAAYIIRVNGKDRDVSLVGSKTKVHIHINPTHGVASCSN